MATKTRQPRRPTGPAPSSAARPATGSALWRERSGQTGWALLPLRVFLGATMLYAALLKLLDPAYLDETSPAGVRQQMQLTAVRSPIGAIVTFAASHAALFGMTIALGELAVGVGLVLGAFTRLAALGGVVLSLTFFLTLSWGTSPYFFGSDIVFVFAFTPLLIAGDGGVLSIRSPLRRTVRRGMGLAVVAPASERPEVATVVDRRTVVRTGVVAGLIGLAAAMVGVAGGALRRAGYAPTAADSGLAADLGPSTSSVPPSISASPSPTRTVAPSRTATPSRSPAPSQPAGSAPPTTATPDATPEAPKAPAGGIAIGPASAVPVGSAARFTDPRTGKPAIVVQPRSGTFLAYSAVCTHEGCTVGYDGRQFACPCHGATYSTTTGSVTGGPAPLPLSRIRLAESGGQLYVV